MTVETKNRYDIKQAVHDAVQHHGTAHEELIPVLNQVNKTLGYLPKEAMDEISRLLSVPKSQVLSVASFYYMFSTERLGEHVIKVCESAPCHVVGGDKVIQELKEHLGLKLGETSKDGKWSLIGTSCLGICGVGPVITIDDDIYGNITPGQIPEILSRYH